MQTATTPKLRQVSAIPFEALININPKRLLLCVSSDRLEWLGINRGDHLGIEKRKPLPGDLLAFWHNGRVRVGRFAPAPDLYQVEIDTTKRGIVRIPVNAAYFIGVACQHFSSIDTTL